ncbi:hypothetical protein ACFLTP_08645 [Chloroflexota bacterium]
MKIKLKLLLKKRGRKYPIARDEYGQSLRQRAFKLFRVQYRPAQVSKMLPISMRTACRYFEYWKKMTHKVPFSHIKQLMKKNPELSEYMIGMLAEYYGVPRDLIVLRMQKPWGIRQLLKGEFPKARVERARSEIEQRLEAGLRLVLFADMFQKKKPEVVKEEIGRIIFGRGTNYSEQDQE